MMTPVGRLVLVRTVDRRELVNAMAWVSIPAMIGPLMGPPLGGFITTYATWHWIFLINVPIGLIGIVLATRYIENIKAVPAGALRSRRHGAGRPRHRRRRLRAVGGGLRDRAVAGRSSSRSSAWSRSRSICGTPGKSRRRSRFSLLALPASFRAGFIGGFLFRWGSAPCRSCCRCSCSSDSSSTLRVGPGHVHRGGRRVHDEGRRRQDPQALRLPHRARRKRLGERCFRSRPARFSDGTPFLADRSAAAGRRLLPLAAVHQHQHHRLCRGRRRG